jgi:hypothetical protein
MFQFTVKPEDFQLRLDVFFTPLVAGISEKGAPAYSGTLGLGPISPLWAHWGNYTLSTKRLDLGMYNPYGQRDYLQKPPVLLLSDQHNVTLGDGSTLRMDFNLASPKTTVPYGLNFTQVLLNVTINAQNCKDAYKTLGFDVKHCLNRVTMKPDQYQTIIMSNGIRYQALDYSVHDYVIFGTTFVDSLYWYRDIYHNAIIITEDAFFMNHVSLALTASLVLAFLLAYWGSIAESKTDRRESFEFVLLLVIEGVSYYGGFIVLLVDFTMLDWDRYISVYSSTASWYAVTFTFTIPILSTLMFLYSLYNFTSQEQYLKTFKKNGLLRAAFFVTSQIAVIWLCLVHQHETILDRVVLCILISAAAVLQMVVVFLSLIHGKVIHFFTVLALLTATEVFSIIYNLLPIFNFESASLPLDVACIMWVVSFEFVPAFFISCLIHLNSVLP